MKLLHLTILAAGAAVLPFSHQAFSQEGSPVQAEAFKILDDAFTFYQSSPVQFTSRSEISQQMGARKNDMVITQRITLAKGAVSIIGTSPDFPAPSVYFSGATATVLFEKEESYVKKDGFKSFKEVYESADLGYNARMGANSLVGATPSTDFFDKLFAADSAGRRELISALKVDGEEVVSGTPGKRLLGTIKANPVGLPLENVSVPFKVVIATGDTPILLSYKPDNTALIESFTKNRPQLAGDLKVTMNCSYTDWKTGADVDTGNLEVPDVSSMKQYDNLGDLITAIQSGGGVADANELKGKPAPDFELETADGGKFKLSDEKGKNVVVLDFWATWCGPCVQAMPIIDKVTRAHAAKGVKLIAVNLRETEDDVKAFMKQHKLSPIVAMDRDGDTAEKYRVSGIPQTVVIDKQGNVSQIHVGLVPNLEEQLNSELEALVAE